jgi:hypothetical protein
MPIRVISDSTLATQQYGDVLFGEGEEVSYNEENPVNELETPRRSQGGWGQFSARVWGRSYEFTGRTISQDPAQVATLTFSSYSGGLLGELRTDIRFPIIKNVKFTNDDKGCADFEMVLNALPMFNIPPGTVFSVRIGQSPTANYTGYVEFNPENGTRKDEYTVLGYGFRKQLKEWVKMPDDTSSVYPFGMTAGEIFDDIMQNLVVGNTNVKYNAAKIDLTAGQPTANELDFATNDIATVFDSLALIGGCDWGVDEDGEAFFTQKSAVIKKVWFIGDGMGSFETSKNSNDIRNSIIVERSQARGSGGNGYQIGGVYRDETSIAKYGLRELTYKVPGFFGDDEIDIIGPEVLEERKEPKLTGKMKRIFLRSESDILPRGRHKFILPLDSFSEVLLEDSVPSDWSGSLALTNSSTFVVEGATSLRMALNADLNEEIEADVDLFGQLEFIEIWLYATATGQLLEFGFGLTNYNENLQTIRIPVANAWYKFRWNVSATSQQRIKKVGFKILTNSILDIYLDNINARLRGQQHITMQFKRGTYNIGESGIWTDAEFGQLPKSTSDYTAGLLQQAAENSTALRRR